MTHIESAVTRRSWLQRAGRALLELYPLGLRLFLLAPPVVAFVVVPEFAQHVVEIRLGMFESAEAFREMQSDPTRMAFGSFKIAGLVLTFFAAARFFWTRSHGGRWWDVRQMAWVRLLIGVLIFFGAGSLPELLRGRLSDPVQQAIGVGWAILLLPSLFMLLAGLFGDRSTPVRDMWSRAWPWLLLTLVLAVLGFGPSAWLHKMNHVWALGADPALVWALMAFDSLLVGLLAGLTGTAFFLGYAAFAEDRQRIKSATG